MSMMTRRAWMFAALVSLFVANACGGGNPNANNPLSPTSPGGTAPVAGPWTGTLTRPGDLGTLSVRWEATTNADGLIGPLTLTNAGTSVTVTARGNVSGNDRQGYEIFVSFNQNAGDAPTSGCAITASSAGGANGNVPFAAPYNRITIPTLDISYSGCRGGVISTGYSNAQSNFLRENARLEMSK